jgi:hypothetical protein
MLSKNQGFYPAALGMNQLLPEIRIRSFKPSHVLACCCPLSTESNIQPGDEAQQLQTT